MKTAQKLLVVWLGVAVLAYAQGNTFDQIRYNGGTMQTQVDPKDWGNRLTVTSEAIGLELKDGQRLKIDPRRVSGLSYGQEAHRRVGTMIALGILLAPLALFGLLHKTRVHFVGIEFTTEEGKKSGVLLQAHKDNYRAVLMALRGVTGAPIAVAEEDRKYVPTGVETVGAQSAAKGSDKPEASAAVGETVPAEASASLPAQAAPAPTPVATSHPSTIVVKSSPEGAEITVGGKYMGSTPSTLRLAAGDHVISINKAGFLPWQRTITVSAGGEITIDAKLDFQAKPLRLDEITNLLVAGVANERLEHLVEERGVDFRLSADMEEKLRQAGAQEGLLQVIRKTAVSGSSN